MQEKTNLTVALHLGGLDKCKCDPRVHNLHLAMSIPIVLRFQAENIVFHGRLSLGGAGSHQSFEEEADNQKGTRAKGGKSLRWKSVEGESPGSHAQRASKPLAVGWIG